MTPFVHLHIHSEYSIVDSTIQIESLIAQAKQMNMPAIALTDQSVLFAMVKFYSKALSAGIKPIIGADLRIEPPDKGEGFVRAVFLCQNREGYHNLSELITLSFTQGQSSGLPVVKRAWLERRSAGLIVLSGSVQGDIGQDVLAGRLKEAEATLQFWLQLYPDRFYLEIQRTGREGEDAYNNAVLSLASQYDVPVVATNDVCFLLADDFEAHEARVCIQGGWTLANSRRPKNYSNQQYLRSGEEMQSLFADIPEALENCYRIAQRCNLQLQLGSYFLPEFPVPENHTVDDSIAELAQIGLAQRLKIYVLPQTTDPESTIEQYRARLELELGVIRGMGFSGYFLIVADFIDWAKKHDIPVGPGRGSGAGSLVAYCLGITDLDPLQYDLLFERFLNPERVSMPDFDVDFCMDRRDEVINYVAQRYGRDRVSQIITHGSMAAKAVVRDVGRVLGYPYGFVDQIAKLIPFDLSMTLERALNEEQALRCRYEQEDEVRTLFDLALKLEGLTRNAGKHAGGVVIAPRPLTEFMPLYCEQDSPAMVTQLDMGDVETLGLVKFDFLGLRTLTIIHWAVQDINRLRSLNDELPLDITQLPLDDSLTFELIRRAETTAVFQLESRGMKDLIRRLLPDVFEDLIALVALFRPGPLQSGMVDDFINRKHGRAKVIYPHPSLEAILKPTYGVILYQEQVMQIAQVLSGYTLGAADLLRRAMGKKKPEEMAKQRSIFTEGAVANQVSEETATGIFDLMEKFAGYGFNKSHSAAYALVSYQTAWLKTHYPAAFMAAVLSSDMDNTDKVVAMVEECKRMQLQLIPPHINRSRYKFTIADERSILFGLGAIKGVGESAISIILEQRDSQGDFLDLFDFCQRIDSRKVNRRVMEAMIRSGAFDGLGPNRARLMASLEQATLIAEKRGKDAEIGQNDMFGFSITDISDESDSPGFVVVEAWSEAVRLEGEKDTLGFYLSGHPIDNYLEDLEGLVDCRLAAVTVGKHRLAGFITSIRTNNTRRGRMAVATLDDNTARIDVVIYAEMLQKYAEILNKGHFIVVEGQCNHDDFNGGISVVADAIYNIEEARSAFARGIRLHISANHLDIDWTTKLHDILLRSQRGTCPILIQYANTVASVTIKLGANWRVLPIEVLLDALKQCFGRDSVHILY